MVAKKSAKAKGPTAKMAESKPKKAASAPITELMTKAQLYAHIAESTGLARKDVTAIFDELSEVIGRHVKKNGVGQFKLAGLMKVKVVRKPATKSRKGVNPFTGAVAVKLVVASMDTNGAARSCGFASPSAMV